VVKPARTSIAVERAAAHLLRARTELDEAAHLLASASQASCERLAISADAASAQARIAEALAAAIHAAPHTALDDLVAALSGASGGARAKRH